MSTYSREKTYFVVNLGSSYITGMLASKHTNGRIAPIAMARRPSGQSIRHGAIHNVDEAARIISAILDELSNQLPENEIIKSVYIGLECKSMQAQLYHTSLSLSAEGEIITQDHLQTLRDQVQDAQYPGMEILRVADARYYIDGKQEDNPRGVRCSLLEAAYQIIVARRSIIVNIRETFEHKLGLHIHDLLIAPLAEAVVTIHPEEAMLGCAYINIGGGCTSISIYDKRLLSALYILPMGGIDVTRDLTDLQLLETDAERLKINYGSMNLGIDREETIQANSTSGSPNKLLKRYEINRYISARMTEIMANVIHIIQTSGHEESIRSGLIISGGATNIDHFFETEDKQPMRRGRARRELVSDAIPELELGLYQTELGLVYQAKEECIEVQLRELSQEFDPAKGDDTSPETTISPSNMTPGEDTEQELEGYVFGTAQDQEDKASSLSSSSLSNDAPTPTVASSRGKNKIFDWFKNSIQSTVRSINGSDGDE